MRRVLLTLCLVLVPVVVLASEGGAHHEVSMKMEIFRIVNFVIFLWLLYKFTGKAVRNYFVGRREQIAASIEEAKRAQEEAKKSLEEAKARIAGLEKEVSQILANAEKERDEQIARMREETQRMVERVREQAKAAADLEVKKAKTELQREAIDLAVNMAENLLRERITPEDQKNLITDYINKVKEVH